MSDIIKKFPSVEIGESNYAESQILRLLLSQILGSLLFEQNNEDLQRIVKDYLRKNVGFEHKVLFNNSSEVIDRNMVVGHVYFKAEDGEFVDVSFTCFPTGMNFNKF